MNPDSDYVAAIWRKFLVLGPPPRLMRHVELVMEAAELILDKLLHLEIDSIRDDRVRAGVILHDAGKILHPDEIDEPGNLHERAGYDLVSREIDISLARHCLTHAQWRHMSCSAEELIVALSDSLWKGRRWQDLEEVVIRLMGDACGDDKRWAVHMQLDTLFEEIAAGGHDRLERSRV